MVPQNLALRLTRKINDKSILDSRLLELKSFLTIRKYPTELISRGFENAINMPDNARNNRNPTANFLTFNQTYNPRNVNIKPIIMSLMNILKTDSRMKSVLDGSQLLWLFDTFYCEKC